MTALSSSGHPEPRPPGCTPKPRKRKSASDSGAVSLPILNAAGASSHHARPRSHMGKWRAAVLLAVHLAIAAHVVLWLYTGMTVSPVEPSESMQTLREGTVNAGFVFFALAILSTLIMGRFFCGWACHVVALQDLCTWIMGKCGIKPKPFRSRLLIWVPLLLALYMFVWPVFHREVLRPLFMDARGRLPSWMGQSDPILGYGTEFLVRDFWATFPVWYVAVPFLLVCGFATVYFLGSKGFCTYGCPYGGFFAPADRLAPGRIRVTDDCEGCGHCTAVCTSNVRVHEEVRDFGTVVDPGCMKCLDCVSACPKDALYVGFGAPAVLTRPRTDESRSRRARTRADRAARYDLDRWEELVAGALFLFFFLAFRAMLNQVPMLMAAGMAGVATFLCWKAWSLVRRGTPNVRIHGWQLRLRGRVRPAGWLVAALALATVALAAWSGYVRATRYAADSIYAEMETPMTTVLRPDFAPTPAEAAAARRALAWYGMARPVGLGDRRGVDASGGAAPGLAIGWDYTPAEWLNIAYLRALLGDLGEAQRLLEHVVEHGNPKDALVVQLGQIMQARAAPPANAPPQEVERAVLRTQRAVLEMYARTLRTHPDLDEIRGYVARYGLLAAELEPAGPENSLGDRSGEGDAAPSSDALREQASLPRDRAAGERLWDDVALDPHPRATALFGKASFLAQAGDAPAAVALVDRAAEEAHTPDTLLSAAGMHAALGNAERAASLALEVADGSSRNPGRLLGAAGVLAQTGKRDEALALADRAAARLREIGPYSGRSAAYLQAAMLNLRLGRAEQGRALLAEAVRSAQGATWDLAGIAMTAAETGMRARDPALLKEATGALEAATRLAPESATLRHDYASVLGATGRTDEALAQMAQAVRLAPTNPALASRYAEILEMTGKSAEAAAWRAKAAALAAPP